MPAELITRNVQEVIQEVKRIFGDEAAVQITDSDIIRWIDMAQSEVVMRNAELGAAVALVNSVADQIDYPVLANVPNLLTIQSIHFKGRPLKNLTFQEAESYLMKGGEIISGTPEMWYERGGIVSFHPPASESIDAVIKIYFNKTPDAVTAQSLLGLPDNYYNSIVAFVLNRAYLLDENPNLANLVNTDFDKGVTRLQERTQSQTNSYPFIGTEDEYYAGQAD